jgi:hypothetical protein
MADETLSPSTEWKKVRRAYRVARFAPMITIRKNGDLALTADFVRKAGIAECTRASLFLSADGLKLAFQFHSDEGDDDAFGVQRDGGGGRDGEPLNRLITAKALLSQSPVITALIREAAAARRYEPRKDIVGRWVISLAPAFELTVTSARDIPSDATGIYRYMHGADAVYIGRGKLRDRMALPERRVWTFDRIEYSVIGDDAAERHWEAFWLNEYRRRHSRWPIYNRIAGVSGEAQAAG